VVVRQLENERVRRQFTSPDVRLVRSGQGTPGPVIFDLVLTGCEVVDADLPGQPNLRESLTIKDLVAVGLEPLERPDPPSADLFARAEVAGSRHAPALADATEGLHARIRALQFNITSRLHLSHAMSVTALLLLLLGATLAMWRREGAPLTIYLWAFLPSVLDLILISSGAHLIRDGNLVGGFAVMWSGNAALGGMLAFAYARLSRH
jgi:hypothetical protein